MQKDMRKTMRQKRNAAGYTLIEALVAITIIVFATTGPLELAGKSLGQSYYARDQIAAFYLAQEGIEMVRAMRDSLGPTWLSDLSVRNCTGSNTCDVDATTINGFRTVSCTSSDSGLSGALCKLLVQYPTKTDTIEKGRLYEPDVTITPTISGRSTRGAVTSKFVRDISIRPVASNTAENKVSVTVRWQNGLNARQVTIEENIFTL